MQFACLLRSGGITGTDAPGSTLLLVPACAWEEQVSGQVVAEDGAWSPSFPPHSTFVQSSFRFGLEHIVHSSLPSLSCSRMFPAMAMSQAPVGLCGICRQGEHSMPWLGLWSRVLAQTRQPTFTSGVPPFHLSGSQEGCTACRMGDRSGHV